MRTAVLFLALLSLNVGTPLYGSERLSEEEGDDREANAIILIQEQLARQQAQIAALSKKVESLIKVSNVKDAVEIDLLQQTNRSERAERDSTNVDK